jgi:uncharacterized membrane protein YqjE
MPTHAAKGSVGGAAKQVAEHASALARLELELASLELKRKAGALGAGAALGAAAGLLTLFGLGFGLATITVALANVLDTWLALLLVTAGILLVAGLLGLLALSRIRRGTPPVPEQALHEAKLTSEALKANGNR